MKYAIKFFNSCLYGKVSYIAVMFNCNKNDLFNPLNTKKNLFSKKNLISKWHSIYLSIVPVRKVPLCNCPNI